MAREKLLAQRPSPAVRDEDGSSEWMWGDEAVQRDVSEHRGLREERDGGYGDLSAKQVQTAV